MLGIDGKSRQSRERKCCPAKCPYEDREAVHTESLRRRKTRKKTPRNSKLKFLGIKLQNNDNLYLAINVLSSRLIPVVK